MSERFTPPNEYQEIRSATAEEIRLELGLDLDASQQQVVAARWERMKASMDTEDVSQGVEDSDA